MVLFWTKVGPYTEEEFETAFAQFKKTGRPLIFTFFRNVDEDVAEADTTDLMTVWRFQERFEAAGHFFTSYRSSEQLLLHLSQQLEKLASTGFVRLDAHARSSEVLVSVREMTEAVSVATRVMLGFAERLGRDVAAHEETLDDDTAIEVRHRLIDIARMAKTLAWHYQSRVIEDLDEWLAMEHREPHQWQSVVENIRHTAMKVQGLLQLVASERSDFVLESAYDTLLESMSRRLAILEKLGKLSVTGENEIDAVRRLNVRYKALLQSFRNAIKELERYLAPRAAEQEARQREREAQQRQRQEQESIERHKRIDEILAKWKTDAGTKS